MANTAPATSDNTLEQSLNRTDLGHWLYEHRKSFIAAVVLVFAVASGWLLYKQMTQSKAREVSQKVYQFEQATMAELRKASLTPADFAVKFSALEAVVQSSPSMLPLALEAARLAEEKNDLVSAQAILKPVVLGLTASSAFYPFVAHNYAAYAEQNGQVDEALRIYADYIKAGHKVLLVKAYLEVGRLQLMKGNKTEAKTHFDYIVANHPNDELTKLAKLYLQQLK